MPAIRESFQWLRHFELTNPKGKWVRFKGVALYPTISGNQRKYVEEELIRAARTLVGKPITVNHNLNRIVGNVEWAEHEDGCTEYIGQIDSNKAPEYAEKLRDMFTMNKTDYIIKWGVEPIYGVSVEANYLHHNEDCTTGLCTVEPHGIIYSALSLVEDPETPGVHDTTMELVEMKLKEHSLREAQVMGLLLKDYVQFHDMPNSLFESYNSNVVQKIQKVKTMPKKKKEEVTKASVSHEKVIAHLPTSSDPRAQFVMMEQETPADTATDECPEGEHKDPETGKCVPDTPVSEQEEPCPEGEHRDPETGECVKDTAAEQEGEPCPEGQVRNPETGECEPKAIEQEECPEGMHKDESGQCVPDKPPSASVPEFPEDATAPVDTPTTPKPEVSSTAETIMFRLGEPFADYTSFDDCVSKNQQAEDPEAYCATIKRQTEERQQVLKKLDQLHEEVKALKKEQDTKALEQLHKEAEIKETIKRLEETLGKLGFNIESIRRTADRNRQQRNSDMKTVKEHLGKVATYQRSHEASDKREHASLNSWQRARESLDKKQCASIGELKTRDQVAEKKYQVLGGVVKQAVNVLSSLNETLTTKATTEQMKEMHQTFDTKLAQISHQFKDIGNAYENLKKLEEKFQEYKKTEQKTMQETLETDKKMKNLKEELEGQIDTLKKHIPANFKAPQKPPEDQPQDDEIVTSIRA